MFGVRVGRTAELGCLEDSGRLGLVISIDWGVSKVRDEVRLILGWGPW